MVDWRDPKVYFKVLVAVNFLNYLDRGIIPGAILFTLSLFHKILWSNFAPLLYLYGVYVRSDYRFNK